jgi:membrane protease YdiL (CAAX protease family)
VIKENRLRTIIGPLVLLALIFLTWYVRYPLWYVFSNLESIFLMLILSYFAVLIFSLLFLKEDSKKSLSQVFKTNGYVLPLVGIGFALLFQILWFSLYLLFGGKLEFSPIPNLEDYSSYAFYSIISAFALYLVFAIFGAFVEEVTFRSYVQSRISSRFNGAVGIFVGALFFSLQHIHIFNVSWVARFFQSQFIYVFFFGIFAGYLFIKSSEDLWSVFAFHGTMNFFNVSLPVNSSAESLISNQGATIITFILMILFLRLMFRKRRSNESG